MGKDAYRRLVRRLRRPTPEEIARVAHWISDDHSWYKHLPMRGAGEPFFVYLRPYTHAVWVDTEAGTRAVRELVYEDPSDIFRRIRIDLQPGDVDPEVMALDHYANGLSTQDWRARTGFWSYWNHGRSDQPRQEAVPVAAASIRVRDDRGADVPVPKEVLKLGLIYLRATVSPTLGSNEAEYDALRRAHNLQAAGADRRAQLEELVAAMEAVVAWVYD